ncbi:MAG: hypothetical protein EOP16_03495 [Pseudonocardia sp.]|nr:MAG: hypothetical protein EOP16_03495 [Pseudonocardia sp.]
MPVRERFREHGEHLPGQLDRGRGALAGPEADQDRQAHRVAAERQIYHDPGDDLPMPRPSLAGPCAARSWVQNA